MSFSTQSKTIQTRKAHRCEWCAEVIEKGAEAKAWFFADGGYALTMRMHPECYTAMVENLTPDDEYFAGDNPRGCACGFSAGCECGWKKRRDEQEETE
jgi:hypothetical protein